MSWPVSPDGTSSSRRQHLDREVRADPLDEVELGSVSARSTVAS
jgi:hypothetical protein